MKRHCLIGILSSLTTIGWCSSDQKDQTICFVNEAPILVKISSSAIAQKQKDTFTMLPGKVSVMLIDRKEITDADHMIVLAKPRNINELKDLQITLLKNGKLVLKQSLKQKNDESSMIEAELKTGDTISLVIRGNDNLYNKYYFIAITTSPTITGYRSIKNYDSTSQLARQKQARIQKSPSKEFIPLTTPFIAFQPGSLPEFRFNNEPLLKDSIIEYRIADQSIIGPWKKSGQILAIPNLLPGNDYQLYIRYKEQKETRKYQFSIQPFWYQSVTTKWLVSFAVFLLIILLIRGYYKNRLKKSMEQRLRLEEQLKTIQSQLNPHFIFNALNSIEGLVTTGKTKLANDYLNNFSVIMRATLNNSDKLFISLEQELNLLEKYLQIEQLRFGFNYQIEVSTDLSLNEVEVPPMLLQPLAENAVKHGLSEQGHTKRLQIKIFKNQTDLICHITNPLNIHRNSQRTAGGYGLAFTQQRLEHFKKLHPQTPILFHLNRDDKQVTIQLIYKNWFS